MTAGSAHAGSLQPLRNCFRDLTPSQMHALCAAKGLPLRCSQVRS